MLPCKYCRLLPPAIAFVVAIGAHAYLLRQVLQATSEDPVVRAGTQLLVHIAPAPMSNREKLNPVPSSFMTRPSFPLGHNAESDAPDHAEPTGLTHYFTPGEVTRSAQVIRDLPADFLMPITALPGTPIRMRLRIAESGVVDEALVDAPANIDGEARKEIEAAFGTMQFAPALIGHLPVPYEMRVEVNSSLPGETPPGSDP